MAKLNNYYEAISLSVSTTGYYTIRSNSTFDTYGYIYKNNFDPTTPYVNLLQQNGDGDGSYQFLLSVFLEASTPYFMIVTTFSPNVVGCFSLIGASPDWLF